MLVRSRDGGAQMDLDRVKGQADKVKAEAETERRIGEIRAQPHLSDQSRRVLIAAEVKKCSDQLDRLRTEMQAAVAVEREGLERRVWSNTRPEDVVGFRDALARAAALKDPDEARSLFRRATLSGDQQLARAIALDRRFSDLTADYRRQDPEWGQAAEALIDHGRSVGSAKFKCRSAWSPAP